MDENGRLVDKDAATCDEEGFSGRISWKKGPINKKKRKKARSADDSLSSYIKSSAYAKATLAVGDEASMNGVEFTAKVQVLEGDERGDI